MHCSIKAKDIKDFERYTQELDYLIRRIRKYAPNAYIYATPSQLNLMSEYKEETKSGRVDTTPVVTSTYVTSLDCGDW